MNYRELGNSINQERALLDKKKPMGKVLHLGHSACKVRHAPGGLHFEQVVPTEVELQFQWPNTGTLVHERDFRKCRMNN